MSSYSNDIASHYAAYRPPIHQLILNENFEGSNFDRGLDIGCGTGISTVALSRFCTEVQGIDPSRDMLERAEETESIHYSLFDGEKIPFPDDEFDVITFAGSLFYTNRKLILPEVCRVLTDGGVVLVYDFRINLDEVLERLGFEIPLNEAYDHSINFDDLHPEKLILAKKSHTINDLHVTLNELLHLLLSEQDSAYQFYELIPDRNPELMITELRDKMLNDNIKLEVHLFFTLYRYLV